MKCDSYFTATTWVYFHHLNKNGIIEIERKPLFLLFHFYYL